MRTANLGFEATALTPAGPVRVTSSGELPAESQKNVVSVTCPHGFKFTSESIRLLDRLSPVFELTADSVSNTHLLVKSIADRSLTTLKLKNADLTEEDFELLLARFRQGELSITGSRISEETIRALKPNYPLIQLDTDYGEFPISVASD